MRNLILLLALLLMAQYCHAQTPEIISTMPSQNELNVYGTANISVTFNIDMNSESIDSSTFIVNARSSGLYHGTISYDSQTRTVVFIPQEIFKTGELITVVLTSDIQSSEGISLDNGYCWSFTIRAEKGFGNFLPHETYPVDDNPASLIAADFDDDGDYDLAAAIKDIDSIAVMLNVGNGIFTQGVKYASGDQPRSIFSVDLDNDFDPDLVTANMQSNNVSVLFNNGDGTYSSSSEYTVGLNPQSVYAADLDCDGDNDLAVANVANYMDPIYGLSVLLNDGSGVFSSHQMYPLNMVPACVHAADLDNDGDQDLISANFKAHNISVLLNNGEGVFAARMEYPTDNTPNDVYAADLDEDGDLDLAVSCGNFANVVSVLLNYGDATFAPHVTYPVGDYQHGEQPFCIFAADLDGDKDLDLVTGNVSSSNITLLPNNGDGTFGQYLNFAGGYGLYSVFAVDLDDDGDLDLATANYGSSDVSVFINHFICADVNNDKLVNVSDAVGIINYVFTGGIPPDPMESGDTNCDGEVNVSDAVWIINYVFVGGKNPCDTDGDDIPDC